MDSRILDFLREERCSDSVGNRLGRKTRGGEDELMQEEQRGALFMLCRGGLVASKFTFFFLTLSLSVSQNTMHADCYTLDSGSAIQ